MSGMQRKVLLKNLKEYEDDSRKTNSKLKDSMAIVLKADSSSDDYPKVNEQVVLITR